MIFYNIDLFDKLNVINYLISLFSFNFIKNINLFVRLPYIKKEDDLVILEYLFGLEYWSNNKVLIKKINFFYKLNMLIIELFFKISIIQYLNWLFYYKFILIPYYIKYINDYLYLIFYKNYLTFFIFNIYKLQSIFKINTPQKNLIKYIIIFSEIFLIKSNINILFFISIIKNFINNKYITIWSIYI